MTRIAQPPPAFRADPAPGDSTSLDQAAAELRRLGDRADAIVRHLEAWIFENRLHVACDEFGALQLLRIRGRWRVVGRGDGPWWSMPRELRLYHADELPTLIDMLQLHCRRIARSAASGVAAAEARLATLEGGAR